MDKALHPKINPTCIFDINTEGGRAANETLFQSQTTDHHPARIPYETATLIWRLSFLHCGDDGAGRLLCVRSSDAGVSCDDDDDADDADDADGDDDDDDVIDSPIILTMKGDPGMLTLQNLTATRYSPGHLGM